MSQSQSAAPEPVAATHPAPEPVAATHHSTSQSGPSSRPPVAKGDMVFSIGLTILEIALSIIVFQLARSHGASEVAGYLWASLVPVVGAIVYFLKSRVVSGASVCILAFNLLSAVAVFVGSHDAKILLYKDCFVTGIIGVIFLATMVIGKPLAFYFGQRFATGGTPEGIAWWNSMWQYEGFRHSQRVINLIWGVVFLAEAIIKAILIGALSFNSAYTWTQIMPIAATAIGLFFTFRIARKAREEGKRRAAQAAR